MNLKELYCKNIADNCKDESIVIHRSKNASISTINEKGHISNRSARSIKSGIMV
jgi:hypothetical protein